MAYVRVVYYEGFWPWRSGLVIATLLLDRLVGGHSAIGACPFVIMSLFCNVQRCYPCIVGCTAIALYCMGLFFL